MVERPDARLSRHPVHDEERSPERTAAVTGDQGIRHREARGVQPAEQEGFAHPVEGLRALTDDTRLAVDAQDQGAASLAVDQVERPHLARVAALQANQVDHLVRASREPSLVSEGATQASGQRGLHVGCHVLRRKAATMADDSAGDAPWISTSSAPTANSSATRSAHWSLEPIEAPAANQS